VIAQQGVDWGNPIGWVFILLMLVCLGLLAGGVRIAFSPTPGWDDDRSGLRRAIAGFPGGRPMLGALGALILATLVFAAISSPEADKGPVGVRPPPPPAVKVPEGGKSERHSRRGGHRPSKPRGGDASRAREAQSYRALGGERIAVRGPKGAKGDTGPPGPKGDRGMRWPRGRTGLRGPRGASPRRSGGGSEGGSGRAGGGSASAAGGSRRGGRGSGGRPGLSEALSPVRKLCARIAGLLRCP